MYTDDVPVDFGDLITRVAAPAVPSARVCRPVVASATELPDNGPISNPRLWVILHTITRSTVQLLHSRPLRCDKLSVRIDGPSGEIINVLLAVASTAPRGEIYETTASFYR
ncbi:MAG TPA: hypothetical protein VHC22_00765 [Pirellulales bacterium]|nr:hypothetical protein [Pirellulales bacterium]